MKNILLSVFAVMLTCIGAEIAYRMYLRFAGDLTYHASNRALHEYDSATGYRFVPGLRATTVSFYHGKPTLHDTISVGPYGNLGNGVKSWTDDDFKILAFGDSFTAYPFAYNSWTEYIGAPLLSVTNKNVEVMNLGRDGFGLLQIVRLANITLQNTKADLTVIAFIPADLGRARIWRTRVEADGVERELMSTEQSASPDVKHASDVLLIDPTVTPQWIQYVFDSSSSSNSFVEPLHKQFRHLLSDNLNEQFSVFTLLLYNRIRFGDPYFPVRKVPRNPSVGFQRFEEDKVFMEDVKNLLSSNTPVVFIMLPGYEDMKAGKILFSEQEQRLYENLTSILPVKIYNLLERAEFPRNSIDSFFLMPEDGHPSKRGAEWFTKEIVKAIQDAGVLTSDRLSDQE
ncbi:MAG: SGNH/GDSL hydrolase family protein [bacterium]